MNKLLLMIALPLLVMPGLAQTRTCLRIMPVEELTRISTLIARVKVYKVERARYRGMYAQLAILRPVDVIEGDFTLVELNVLARSNVPCAEDNYAVGQEMLVFLEPQESLFHTVNFQYGQFPINGEIVRGWRDKANKPVDKPYEEVRQEILAHIDSKHTPKSDKPETKPPETKPPQTPPPHQPAM
ncbi:MAG TPA: hypothetical protein VLD57_00605 [Blastocatellia bacterium]|nr:hypothetical protein [Blastocatellia bacterium]